jgi:hypothetical protein
VDGDYEHEHRFAEHEHRFAEHEHEAATEPDLCVLCGGNEYGLW